MFMCSVNTILKYNCVFFSSEAARNIWPMNCVCVNGPNYSYSIYFFHCPAYEWKFLGLFLNSGFQFLAPKF